MKYSNDMEPLFASTPCQKMNKNNNQVSSTIHCLAVPAPCVDIGGEYYHKRGCRFRWICLRSRSEPWTRSLAETQSAKAFMRGRGTEVRGTRGRDMRLVMWGRPGGWNPVWECTLLAQGQRAFSRTPVEGSLEPHTRLVGFHREDNAHHRGSPIIGF